jgi:hypothetical protein
MSCITSFAVVIAAPAKPVVAALVDEGFNWGDFATSKGCCIEGAKEREGEGKGTGIGVKIGVAITVEAVASTDASETRIADRLAAGDIETESVTAQQLLFEAAVASTAANSSIEASSCCSIPVAVTVAVSVISTNRVSLTTRKGSGRGGQTYAAVKAVRLWPSPCLQATSVEVEGALSPWIGAPSLLLL